MTLLQKLRRRLRRLRASKTVQSRLRRQKQLLAPTSGLKAKLQPARPLNFTIALTQKAQHMPAYKRILLKLSGEALMGDDAFGINRATIVRMVEEIAEITRMGVQVAVVIGGGNIFRGVAGGSVGMDRATADYMGMLATVMNALALGDTMDKAGLTPRVMSAIGIERIVEPYVRPKALQYLEEGKVVIFAAGTGNPFFTTDTAAALRGAEIGAEIVLKATKVDGVYSADPKKDPNATRYTSITFDEAMGKNLEVMDATAFALCRDQKLPLKVFSIFKHGALRRVVLGKDEGTLVHV